MLNVRHSFNLVLLGILTGLSVGPLAPLAAQEIRAVRQTVVVGTVTDVKPGELSIKDKNGNVVAYKIQDKDERAVSIDGVPVRIPATIAVKGSIPASLVERGMIVHFFGRANVYGKSNGEVSNLSVLSKETPENLDVNFLERPKSPREPGRCEVTGRVINLGGNKLQLHVAKAKWAKHERITFTLADSCVLELDEDNLNHVQPDDVVTHALVLEFSTGEQVIKNINVQLSANRERITTSFNDELQNRFSHLSDKPGEPRDVRSDHFILYTDISERSAKILLAKLETMYGLVSKYYSARPKMPIECYVVQDLRKWPPERLSPSGIAKIRAGTAVTISRSGGGVTQSIVYSCNKHSIVQHEAVHAFCAQTFGSTGPVWYAEGMAELANYWKPDERAVDIDPIVITYLTNAPPKKMAAIVAAGQITGDSWQAYAWRWALCHLLSNNPNYAKRFKTLGINLMAKRRDSFDKAFGKNADQISFEYDEFVKNFNNGYRVDLCVWDWKTRPTTLSLAGRLKKKVKSKMGWQATKLLARADNSYEYVTEGTWTINSGKDELTAEGDSSGNGKLIGVIFHEFQLSEPFELGEKGTFTPPADGQLFVRCRDRWTSLADNDGIIDLYIRRTPKKNSDD